MNDATIAAAPLTPLAREIGRRRTFAIISHPDAGKTTLTEKLLLFGGAIQLAGQVKAKRADRNTRSDWMAIERARGISVVTSVMTFEYRDTVFNLLDTPGHEDFSDHTYRTLTAVDAAVMVIDAAKGIEARTRKLFEICRLRDIPILTFINKMDREIREPLDLLDEIEKVLALDTAPMVWPIGRGRDFRGTYDLSTPRVRQIDKDADGLPVSGPDDPPIAALMEPEVAERWREEVGLVLDACGKFDLKAFREGTLTPVFFGSALRNFGVRDLLDALVAYAPPPLNQKASTRMVEATEPKMTGVVFKIQANMDPNHRDRIAFMRVCSGKLTRGMKAKLIRTGKIMALQSPQFFFAQDRSIADEAYAGDVVGLPNHGTLQDRRHADRGRGSGVHGHSELRAGNPASCPPRRCDQGEEAAHGAAGDGGRGRGAAILAGRWLAADHRRDRRAATRRAGRPARQRVRLADRLRDDFVRDRALGRRR